MRRYRLRLEPVVAAFEDVQRILRIERRSVASGRRDPSRKKVVHIKKEYRMMKHKVAKHEEWLAARRELLRGNRS